MARPNNSLSRAVGAGAVVCLVLMAGCDRWTPGVPRSDVVGCFRIDLREEDGRPAAPSVPVGLELTNHVYLAPDASEREVDRHRFDAHAAREAFFVYPDTSYRVAWWWAAQPELRFRVGNDNSAAAFYVEAVVEGASLEGEMRRWRYDDAGEPVEGSDSWSSPVAGAAVACSDPASGAARSP